MRLGHRGWVTGLVLVGLVAGACGLTRGGAAPDDERLPEFSAERLGTRGSVWEALEPEEREALERSGMTGMGDEADVSAADPDAFAEPRESTADRAGKLGFSLLMVAATVGSAVAPFFLF